MTDVAAPEPRYRAALLVGAIICLGAGAVLFFGSRHTDDAFAWPMASPLAAVSLAAGLFAGAVLLECSGLEDEWRDARIGVLCLVVATVGLLTATIIDRHRLTAIGSDAANKLPLAGIVSAIWWIALPLLLIASVIALFSRRDMTITPSPHSMPLWARALAGVQGAIIVAASVYAYADPSGSARRLPFAAGVLDVRCLAAVQATIGAALLCAAFVGDTRQSRSALAGLGAFVGVEVAGLIWRRADVVWSTTEARALIGYVAALGLSALVGLVLTRTAVRSHGR